MKQLSLKELITMLKVRRSDNFITTKTKNKELVVPNTLKLRKSLAQNYYKSSLPGTELSTIATALALVKTSISNQ